MANEQYVIVGILVGKGKKSDFGYSVHPYEKEEKNVGLLIETKSWKLLNRVITGNYGSLVIEAENFKTAVKVFESIKFMLGLITHYFGEDLTVLRLRGNGEDMHAKIFDLHHFGNELDKDRLTSGIVLGNDFFKEQENLITLISSDKRLRTALACFYQAQEVFYTNLVGSYIASHGRVDLHWYETDEYSYLNLLHNEKICSSLTTAYRGIEAIMDVNFRMRLFMNDEFKSVIDNCIDGVTWNTKYLKAFDMVRYEQDLSKKRYSKVSTMVKRLLIARNRAGHGKVYTDQKKNNQITIERTHESKRFLEFLIIKYIDSKV
ncbi:hypothetical protein [Guptibacillus sedimenti]|uniref:hypothetical protein n=1 Tax=Guptibacillus sedimenti TaxID=3025680 RepID=UPI00236258A9|nr:hypothetical protein [Pseudalkalibacillus sedimenti]